MRQKALTLYWSLLLVTLALNSCGVRQEALSGIYTIKGLKNNLDTLKILRDDTYVRTLYAQSNRRLLFKNKDKWKAEGGRILLYNFLPDEDEKYTSEAVLGLGTMLCDLPVRGQFGKVTIEAPHMGDEAVYEKL